MKKLIRCKRIIAVFLAVCLLVCCTTVAAETDTKSEFAQITTTESATLLQAEDLPANIQALMPEGKENYSVYLQASEMKNGTYDDAELYTLRTEDPVTGEGVLTVHSAPIKYIDEKGELQFIDTDLQPTKGTRAGYSYRNAANSFTVEYGTNAATGINFDNVFTFAAKEMLASKNVSTVSKAVRNAVMYDDAFGAHTAVEYVNIENGIKENIILEQYTGQTRFEFVFRSETHIPILANDGMFIWIANKNTPKEPEYRFLSLYAYDSYDPAIHGTIEGSTFRHMNEELYYELTSNTDGSYTIAVVVPEEYLTHPEVVYPVTIDPTLTPYKSTNDNTYDTFVDASKPTTQTNYTLDYIRFGKVNGYKNFGYHRFTSLPSISGASEITSATIKFTFRSGQNTPTSSSGVKMGVLQVESKQWSESTITWNNQPYGTEGPIVNITYNGSYLNYFSANITNMVRDWYSGAAPNYGFDFTYSNEEYNDYNSVVSSEGDADRAPVLTINYSTTGLTNNQKYYLRNANSGKYLTIPSSSSADGTDLIQSSFSGNTRQQFKLVYNSAKLDYSLYPVCASSSAIEITNASSANNEIVQIWTKPSSGVMNSQRFKIKKNSDNSYSLLSYCSGYSKAVQIKNGSTSNSAAVVQYDSSSSSNQKWYFERVQANGCSRAVSSMPSTTTYETAVSNSAARWGKMSTAEYLLKATTLAAATATARSAATVAAVEYPVAASMLIHFLDWTGNTYTLPSDFIKSSSDISTKRQEVLDALNGAYNTLKVSNITVTYGNTTPINYLGGSANTDWKLGVNKCELWGKVTATSTTSKQTTLYVRDFYDWEAGDMSTFFNVAADVLNQCHYAGIARDFPVTGSAGY